MWFNIFRNNVFQINICKQAYSEILVPFLNSKKMCIHKFHSNRNGKTHTNRNFQNATCGILSSLGIATLLGIFDHYKKSETDIDANFFERIRYKFSICAATVSPNKFENIASPRTTFNFLADVVEKTQNSVVYIEITARHPLTRHRFSVSNGSGFIVKADGLILTNAHVVNHYGHVLVKLYDGRVFEGVVENIDTESDLATVRIRASNLPELPLGHSTDLRPGEFVIAMGNPLTLSHTITAGVVSSTNRHGEELGLHKKSDYIQTDAAINIGNSGGPLVNLDGEAIGINTMKVTEGISFAIPSDRAIEFLKKIEPKSSWNPFKNTVEPKKQKFLGIGMLTLSPVVIKNLKEHSSDFPSVEHGVLVWKVMIGSPSYEYGIRPGDVISQVNKIDVFSAEEIQAYLEKENVLTLTIQRGQKTFEISVPLVETVLP